MKYATLGLNNETRIVKIACLDRIVHCLSSCGKIYTMGYDTERSGCLGLGPTIYESQKLIVNPTLTS